MRMALALRAFALGLTFLASSLAGCGGADDTTDSDSDSSTEAGVLTIEPATSTHVILNGAPASQPFVATLTKPDGSTQNVTDQTQFFIDGNVGSFAANTLAMQLPGKATVSAAYGDAIGTAQVIVRLESVRVDPTLDPSTPDLFGGTEDAALAPTVLYPPLDVTMPRNVGDFEVHWTDGHAHNVFEISLRTELASIRVYVPGGNGNPAAGPMPSHAAFAATEWLAAVGAETSVLYQVRGATIGAPGPVGASAQRMVRLTNEPVEGGIYYWAAATNGSIPAGIYRHDMANPGHPAEEFFTSNQTGGRCVACHVISRDGTKMAITWDGGGAPSAMVDVATRTAQSDATNWNFATFTPSGDKLLTVSDGVLSVRNAADASVIMTMQADGRVSHPDLNADGTRLVYVRSTGGSDWSLDNGDIYVRSYDPTTNAFGAEEPLVVDGPNNFYPSWSPDAQWVLFNRGLDGTSYDNSTASLWVVKADQTVPMAPMELAKANLASSGLCNSWGRWAPFAQSVGAAQEPMFWLTVSSKRDFGVRLVNARQPQIWMTPFFPGRAAAGLDPTEPSFRLPFQNIDSNNHIAQWTERVVVLQ